MRCISISILCRRGLGTTAAAAVSTKSGTFWRTPEELCGFSTRHIAHARDEHRQRSDVVVLQHAAAPEPGSTPKKGAPPRYSLLCDSCEWTVAPGEHNVWDCLVLFVLHRAKRQGFLDGVNLEPELYTAFMTAMMPQAAAGVKEADCPIAYHGLLSILHPWSQELEELNLDDVARKL
eukprot:5064206-Prymnesium_polylepis.1